MTTARYLYVFLFIGARIQSATVPGHVEAWGYNFFGQTNSPVRFDIVGIAAGGTHNLALLSNSTVIAWGSNFAGESDVPVGLTNVSKVSARGHSVALKKDGTLVVWGGGNAAVTNVPAGLIEVADVEAGNLGGNFYTVALRSNGTVVAWGLPNLATNVPAGLAGIMAVAAGNAHCLALKSNGTVIAWGDNFAGAASVPVGLSNVVAIAAGQGDSYAVKADGTVVAWGTAPSLQLTGIVEITVGASHGLGRRADGSVAVWGTGDFGQGELPPYLQNVSAISAGGLHNLILTARPLITSITPPVQTNPGATLSFTVSALAGPFSYQWSHRGTRIEGATNATLTLSNVQPADAGEYAVSVANPFGVAGAATAVSFPAPTIVTQPQSATLYRGESVSFEVGASGLGPFHYQWTKEGVAVSGGTNSLLTVSNLRSNDAGAYQVIVTDQASASVTSQVATLTVLYPVPPGSNSMVLLPVVDTSIESSGTDPQGVSTILAGTRRNGIHDRGLLRFDLRPIPPEATVTSAKVRLTVVKVPLGGVGSVFSLSRVLRPWGGDATWVNATAGVPWIVPGLWPGSDFTESNSATAFVSGGGPYDFGPAPQMLADIVMWRGNASTNFGWVLKSESEATGKTARHFGASESGDPPQLVITFDIPLPTTRISSPRLTPGAFAFQFGGVAGWIYRVEASDDVATGPWITLTNAPAGAATQPIAISLPNDRPRRFVRIIAE